MATDISWSPRGGHQVSISLRGRRGYIIRGGHPDSYLSDIARLDNSSAGAQTRESLAPSSSGPAGLSVLSGATLQSVPSGSTVPSAPSGPTVSLVSFGLADLICAT